MNKNITTFVLLGIAFVFALVLGTNIASADYESLSIYAVSGIAIYFLVHGWRNVWWFTALLGFSGVVFAHGFNFDASHLFILMLLLASLISFLNRSFAPQSVVINKSGGNVAAFFVGILLVYGFSHFLVNLADPYSAHDYSLKSASKAYFEAFASMVGFFWLIKGPYGFKMNKEWGTRLIVILGLTVIGNTIARGTLYLQGFQASDGLGSNSFQEFFLYVPIINMQAGIYTLRDLCPIAAAILGMMITAPGCWKERKVTMRLFLITVLVSLLAGSVFSGGRVTAPFTLGLLGFVALVRRKTGLIMITSALAGIVILFVNIFSGLINENAPTYIARSLQYVMVNKGSAYQGISGSQDVRDAAFDEALKIWKSDSRVFAWGRSVFEMTGEEALYIGQTMGGDGFVLNAMKSGRTHNLLTDLLLQYGLVGAILYFAAYISVIIFYIRLYRRIPQDLKGERAICGALAIYLPFILIYQLLGGQFMPIVAALVAGILRARLTEYESEWKASQNSKSGNHGLSQS